MADHQRKIIRQAVKRTLTNATAAGTRIYTSRVWPWMKAQLPAISTYTDDENVDVDEARNSAPRQLPRTVQLAIEAVVSVKENEDVEDALDSIAKDIEKAIDADPTFGDTCSTAILASSEVSANVEGERPMGLLRMVYQVLYYTFAPESEDVPLEDFNSFDAKYSIGGTQAPADQAEDTVSLEG